MTLNKLPKWFPRQLKWLPLIIVVFCLLLTGLNIVSASEAGEEYIAEKIDIANKNDWGEYSWIEGTYLVILDGEPYTIYLEDSQASFEPGVPEIYNYKIITTQSGFDKWWKIAEYYFENGKLSWKQKYIDIPWLYLNTPIQKFGSAGNIAYAVQSVGKTTVNIV